MEKGIFYAVGVGVGDPMDMTLRAKQVLEQADVIAVPVKQAGTPSAAFQIARRAADIRRSEYMEIVFPMTAAVDYKAYLSGNVLQPLKNKLDAGKTIAMVTLGDVSIYSTAAYVRQVLEQNGYSTKVIAGVPSFCTAAARAGISLCENAESLTVLPGIRSEETLRSAMKRFDTIIILKAGKTLSWLIPFLEQQNLLKNTVMCCNLGMEQEYIGKIRLEQAGYFTTIIIRQGGLR